MFSCEYCEILKKIYEQLLLNILILWGPVMLKWMPRFLTLQSDTFITFRQNCVNKLDSNNKYWLVFTTNQQITGWPPDSERVKIQEYSKTKYSFNWAWKQQQNIFKIFGSAQCFLGPEEGEERGQDNTFAVVGIYTKKTIN